MEQAAATLRFCDLPEADHGGGIPRRYASFKHYSANLFKAQSGRSLLVQCCEWQHQIYGFSKVGTSSFVTYVKCTHETAASVPVACCICIPFLCSCHVVVTHQQSCRATWPSWIEGQCQDAHFCPMQATMLVAP